MKPADKHIVLLIVTAMLLIVADMVLHTNRAAAVEKKPPLHIRVGQKPEKKDAGVPEASTKPEPQNPESIVSLKGIKNTCPLIITARPSSHFGLRINFIKQDRRALRLATAMREDFFRKGRDTQFISALYDASVQTGTSFELLVIKAMMESNLGTLNFNESSSARGTFQYVESTWLNLMQRYGAKTGYPEYAKMITIDPATMIPSIKPGHESKRQAILNLRHDPYVSAVMKGLQIEEETEQIRTFKKDGKVSITDHYVTHMLGLPLARRFYEMKNTSSLEPLATPKNPAMKTAADLNRPFFYDSDGTPLNAVQSYHQFEKRVLKARKRLHAMLRSYSKGKSRCGRFEPVPPYEPEKPSPIAKEAEARNGTLSFAFFDTPQTESGAVEKTETKATETEPSTGEERAPRPETKPHEISPEEESAETALIEKPPTLPPSSP